MDHLQSQKLFNNLAQLSNGHALQSLWRAFRRSSYRVSISTNLSNGITAGSFHDSLGVRQIASHPEGNARGPDAACAARIPQAFAALSAIALLTLPPGLARVLARKISSAACFGSIILFMISFLLLKKRSVA